MKARSHLSLCIGIAFLVTGLRLGRSGYYKGDYRQVGTEKTEERALEIEATWQKFAYTSIASEDSLTVFLAHIDWKSLGLESARESKLKTRLRQVLSYLHEPEFESYYRLKTEGLRYKFTPSIRVDSLLTSQGNNGYSDAPKSTAKTLWDNVRHQGGQKLGSQLSSVCFNDVAAALTHTNSGQALLTGRVKKAITAGIEALDPGFVYEVPSGHSCFFELSFFAKVVPSGNVGPVFMSLYWDEQDEQWVPTRMISDAWLGFNGLF